MVWLIQTPIRNTHYSPISPPSSEIVVGVASVLSADALDDIDWGDFCHSVNGIKG